MTQLLTTLAILAFGVGNLLSISIYSQTVHIYISDIFVGLLILLNWRLVLRSYSVYSYSVLLFTLTITISWILGLLRFGVSPAIVAVAYLLRWVVYALVPILFVHIAKVCKPYHLLIIISLVFTACGLLQYLLAPDLRSIGGGWDSHYYRLVGTLLDPNFTGLLLVFMLTLFYGRNWWLWSIIYVAMALTYSRSTYLAFLASHLFLSLGHRHLARTLLIPIVLLGTIFILPRPGGEGVRLERTSTIGLRVVNWQSTWVLFTQHPIFGVGFNYLRYARPTLDIESHSAAGADSSLLFVMATTGVVGLVVYSYYLTCLFRAHPAVRPLLLAAIVHSLFNNSLFYPYVLLWLGMFMASADTLPPILSWSGSRLNRWLQTRVYSRLRLRHNLS